ncbi:MAG TPA: hypothetical protein VFG05_07420 [Methylocella sp.]|nr:hypothetical protein [Methylocella sp.]
MPAWRDRNALRATRRSKAMAWPAQRALRNWRLWARAFPLAALALTGIYLLLQPARYCAEAQIMTAPRAFGLIGLRASHSSPERGAAVEAAGVRLIASRSLAQRAIRDLGLEGNSEFDPAANGLNLAPRMLVLLGLMPDPARKSPEDRVLETFLGRIQVSGPGRRGIVRIAFQSSDRHLAARAANRLAELYLDLEANTKPPAGGALLPSRFFARARLPEQPLSPFGSKSAALAFSCAVLAAAAFVITALWPLPFFQGGAEHLCLPQRPGQAQTLSRFKPSGAFARACSRTANPTDEARQGSEPQSDPQGLPSAAARILSASPPAGEALRLLAVPTEASASAYGLMLTLARALARERRSIAVSLDPDNPLVEKSLAGAASEAEPGLCELLDGRATFSGSIRRDPASRLHILPPGSSKVCLQDFESVLDTLARIYEIIILAVPPAGTSTLERLLTAKTRFAVLAAPAAPPSRQFEAQRQLEECGAGEVVLLRNMEEAGLAPARKAA